MFQKIPAQALSESVAVQLLAKIDAGVFARGGKLPTEAMLAQQFGVSRTVVREAISRLKNEGVVAPRQGSGVFITEQAGIKPLRIDYAEISSIDAVMQIVDLRRSIETEVAAQAALHCTAADMRAIDAALAAIAKDVQARGDGVRADVAFHRAIAAATRNVYFTKTLDFLNQYLEAATRVTRGNEARRDDFSRQVLQEHQAIVEAIRARDEAAARRAAQNHLLNAALRLRQADSESLAAAKPTTGEK
jgi:GntR family transcriptional repressor for pyruvate dehydrogenase complex